MDEIFSDLHAQVVRHAVRLVEGGAALVRSARCALPGAACAQDKYPSRDVHVIAAFPAGSGADVFTRYFAENMRPFLGGTIIVENKVGASGNLAINYVARAKPDGYTILIHAPSAIAAAPSLFKDPGFDAEKAFDVLGSVCRLPFTVSVSSKSPYKNMAGSDRGGEGKGRQGELRHHRADRPGRRRDDEKYSQARYR